MGPLRKLNYGRWAVLLLLSAAATADQGFAWDVDCPTINRQLEDRRVTEGLPAGLEEVRFQLFEYSSSSPSLFGGCYQGKRIVMSFRTTRVEQLEQFGFTQWIRGCVVSHYRNADGTILHQFLGRDFMGEPSWLDHPEWEPDNQGRDLMYVGAAGEHSTRHRFYSWNSQGNEPGDHSDARTYSRDEVQRMPRPELWVYDLPSGGTIISDTSATSSALEFKVCLFRAEEIPTSLDESHLFGQPITCFNWDQNVVLDWANDRFVRDRPIEQTCRLVPERLRFRRR